MAIKKKTKTVRKPRTSRVEKTRNGGTMSESGFWGFIRSALRQKSRWWKPIIKVKEKAKVPYTGPNKRQKFSYKCGDCSNLFKGDQVAVHHKVECGSLTCGADLQGFVERLFCEEDGLILLCDGCHDKRHEK